MMRAMAWLSLLMVVLVLPALVGRSVPLDRPAPLPLNPTEQHGEIDPLVLQALLLRADMLSQRELMLTAPLPPAQMRSTSPAPRRIPVTLTPTQQTRQVLRVVQPSPPVLQAQRVQLVRTR